MPDPGEGLTEAEVVSWLVNPGDTVKINDVLCEVETAKSIVELPSPFAGTVHSLAADEGQTVPVGGALIVIDDGSGADDSHPGDGADQAGTDDAGKPGDSAATDGEEKLLVGHIPAAEGGRRRRRRGAGAGQQAAVVRGATQSAGSDERPAAADGSASQGHQDGATSPSAPAGQDRSAVSPLRDADPQAHGTAPQPDPSNPPRMDVSTGPEHVLAKPPARRLAAELGVDLATVTGTGRDGVITRTDVKQAATDRGVTDSAPQPSDQRGATRSSSDGQPQPVIPAQTSGDTQLFAQSWISRTMLGGEPTAPGERRVPIHGVRKVTAEAVKTSMDTKALVTAFLTCDVTPTMDLVARLRADRAFRGLRVSPLTVWCKAVTLAMRRTPVVNASWDDETGQIVHHEQVNLGIAAATPRGLMVPVVRDAQDMTMLDLAQELTRIIAVAKEGRLQPADYTGGTFSITNVGVFGLNAGTPVVNRDESAILVLGSIDRRPWVVGTGDDERIVPRWVTTMSLGFDHRLIDGEQGSTFLHDLAEILSDPTAALLY
ncbi:MAG: dihydrolipoamide acetyltransferase family protein [Cutibacterium granulosum]|uniref:dihydrolipoamide acetyltransferase family protein n=1 Tax=Cutibacterium granulosum TaxID=33011 RepID=UPI002B2358D0|nr:dihydrolipoamide acetyltransferase family protein [Cutibacterium granulosum]MEA5635744.1 dihydrolipoamide acetyltransferase family protein [Cutibacterium granulosum]